MTHELVLNKLYEFNLGDMSHCGFPHDVMKKHYEKNPSPLSFLMEKKLAEWFHNIIYDTTIVKVKMDDIEIRINPDLKDKETRKILFDQKAFNRNGGSFVRSSMKGVGREKNQACWDLWCKKQVVIWTDFCNLPKVKVIAISGKDCLKQFPNGKIHPNSKDELFNNKTLLPITLEAYLDEHFSDEEEY